MKTKSYFMAFSLAIALAFSPSISNAQSLASAANESGVMTKDLQTKLTTDAALKDLMDGNKRFVANRPDKLDMPA